MAEKGVISINAENIMPVIKKWLYSDKDIFLREIVSNACDAIAKYKMLASSGQAQAEENYAVNIVADEEKGSLCVSDNGIGMTADEVRKYIAQVAFSGAEEFLKQYKPSEGENGGIIGHFGLGFYSSFMVSDEVSIDTLSWEDGAQAVRWTSADGMEYEMEPSQRTQRGTTVTMKLSEENHEFLHLHQLRETLEKYCAFMPVPIYLSVVEPPKAEEEKSEEEKGEEKPAEEKKPEQVNETNPLWMRRPSDVTDEEYREFYHKVFHDYRDPLFWIHLNAEYPFNLKGILYFPKLENEFTASEGVIKLYNNQVFVADNIKEVIPEFLMLLKGVIDCPDLPLNVSRSFLQNDGYVRKLSAYITRKVAERLTGLFNTERENYEKYWNDIHPFIKFGCMKDETFYERMKDALLLKTTDGRALTIQEYLDANREKAENKVFYASDAQIQAAAIALYREQGIDVALLDSPIDVNFVSFLEYKNHDVRYSRVDADLSGLKAESAQEEALDEGKLQAMFRDALDKPDLKVTLESLKNKTLPAMVIEEEQMRRFRDMSRFYGGGFAMPSDVHLALNRRCPVIAALNGREADENTLMICRQIYDLAEMARQPLEAEAMGKFIERSHKLLALLMQ